MRDKLTIGRIAREAKTHIETIRFYEREGLLDKPSRTSAGYRSYGPQAIKRLTFIRQAKELGFSLHEIKELLALRIASGSSCADVKLRAAQKIAEMDSRIASLIRIRKALIQLSAECKGKGPASKCPLLDSLEDEECHGIKNSSLVNRRDAGVATVRAQAVCSGVAEKGKASCC